VFTVLGLEDGVKNMQGVVVCGTSCVRFGHILVLGKEF
jgi:hypothetical protein